MTQTEEIVTSIQQLPWKTMNPHVLVWTFCEMGKEYAESVKITQKTYPNNPAIKKLVEEELDTDNLSYNGYNKKADHWKFLEHFLKQNPESIIPENLKLTFEKSDKIIKAMSDEERAMTVFIREKRGPGIFKTILASHDWESMGLGYFKYYLERHIELDSQEGGHGTLADIFPIDERIATQFYQTRLDTYTACIV